MQAIKNRSEAPVFFGQWVRIPAAYIASFSRLATTASETTLPDQISSNQPSRLYQRLFTSRISMVAIANPHFAAEHVVVPEGVHQDHRQDEQCADQGEQLAGGR